MRAMMHIIPHVVMIGLILFFSLISYKRKMEWIMWKGGIDKDYILLICSLYIFLLSWLPSVLIEYILY